MDGTRVMQYALTIKWGNKLIKGLKTTGFSVKPNFTEVLLKESAGNPDKDFDNADNEMSIAGDTLNRATGETATHEDFETMRVAASLGAQVAFIYGRITQGAQQVTGYGHITDWKEDAGSEKKMGGWSGTLSAKRGSVSYGVQA